MRCLRLALAKLRKSQTVYQPTQIDHACKQAYRIRLKLTRVAHNEPTPVCSLNPRTYTKHGPGSMDHLMDPVHGPPWTTPWTRSHGPPPIFKRKSLLSILYENLPNDRRSGYEKQDSYLLLMFLRVCLVKASCFGIAAP